MSKKNIEREGALGILCDLQSACDTWICRSALEAYLDAAAKLLKGFPACKHWFVRGACLVAAKFMEFLI